MTDEIIKETVIETEVIVPETPTEVAAEIAVAKAEAGAERAIEAAQMVEQAAAIQVAQIAIEAEQKIEDHQEKVQELEYDQKWQQEQINSLLNGMEMLAGKVEQLESKLLTPTPSQETPPTVEVITPEENAADQQEQPEPEVIIDQVPQKSRRQIRAL